MLKSNRIKNVILLGRKRGAAQALAYLLAKGIKVTFVVVDKGEIFTGCLAETARNNNIPILYADAVLYRMIHESDQRLKSTDLVISYLYWKRIKQPLLELPRRGCINFHPAPLPDYKGRAGYNTAILDRRQDYGVSVHYIDSEKFDDGPIIEVLKFNINANDETAWSLEQQAQIKLLKLFKKTINRFIRGVEIKKTMNRGGLYLNKTQLENLKLIDTNRDSIEEIDQKIRAFFFPPYQGAKVVINGQAFTLINKKILSELAKQHQRTKSKTKSYQ